MSLRHMSSDQALVLVAVISLVLFFFSMLIGGIQFLLRRNQKILSTQHSTLPENNADTVLPSKPIVAPFVDETDVATALQTYRRNTDARSWAKLNSLEPEILAKHLRKEYPQIAAIVLSKLNPQKSAEVLSLFSGGFAAEVVAKMLNLHSIDADLAGTIGRAIADDIEKNSSDDATNQVLSIFRCLDKATEERIMAVLENTSPSIVASLQNKTMQFTDILQLSVEELRQVLSHVSEPKIVMAMRGATENLRNHFYAAMPDEQANVIREALVQLGPIKFSDIEKAQQDIASICKNMFADSLRGR